MFLLPNKVPNSGNRGISNGNKIVKKANKVPNSEDRGFKGCHKKKAKWDFRNDISSKHSPGAAHALDEAQQRQNVGVRECVQQPVFF